MAGQLKFKHGIRKITKTKTFNFHSCYEANFARWLEYLKNKGKILDWMKNTTLFKFSKPAKARGNVYNSFVPDFLVIDKSGSRYYEVKGWENDKFKAQLNQWNKDYPFVDLQIYGKQWFRENIKLLETLEGYEKIKI